MCKTRIMILFRRAASAGSDLALFAAAVVVPVSFGLRDLQELARAGRELGTTEQLIAVALVALGLVIHEAGHWHEARRAGVGMQHAGMTWVWGWLPAVYVQFDGKLVQVPARKRLRVDLAGSVWQAGFAGMLVLFSGPAGFCAGILAGVLTWAMATWQLIPLPGHDGYHVVGVFLGMSRKGGPDGTDPSPPGA